MTEIEMWDSQKGWASHSSYVDEEHAQRNLQSLQTVAPSMRYRIKPKDKDAIEASAMRHYDEVGSASQERSQGD